MATMNPVMFSCAFYDVVNVVSLLQVLAIHRAFEESIDGGYVVLGHEQNHNGDGGEGVALGLLTVTDDQVIFAAKKQLFAPGKMLLEKTCGSYLRHTEDRLEHVEEETLDMIAELEAAIESETGRRPTTREIFDTIQETADQLQATQEHYLKTMWSKTPLESLDGKSPAEAAADPEVQPKLLHILAELEMNARENGWHDIDVPWMRRMLGIREDE